MEGDCEGRVGVAFGLERREERWGWHKAASTCITRKACIVYWFIDLADSGRIGLEAYYYFSTARSLPQRWCVPTWKCPTTRLSGLVLSSLAAVRLANGCDGQSSVTGVGAGVRCKLPCLSQKGSGRMQPYLIPQLVVHLPSLDVIPRRPVHGWRAVSQALFAPPFRSFLSLATTRPQHASPLGSCDHPLGVLAASYARLGEGPLSESQLGRVLCSTGWAI